LIALFLGILTSIKTFAALITVALKEHPVLIWAFFLGLILSSVVLLVKHIPRWRVKDLLGLVAGALFVAGVSFMTPAQLPGHWWIMFLGGYIGICAMLLPGISGSFILLLVGLYPVFLRAVNELDLLLLVSFGSGAIAGLITFSRFLSWLLQQYHQITIATLIGFLIGSLTVTWPWKQALVTTVDHHGETIVLQSANVLPSTYTAVTGQPHLLFPALACALAGVALVLGLEWIAAKYGKQH
jgi:putative membrane protein